MVGAGKVLVAGGTLKGLEARVRAHVACQLVAARKAPRAVCPLALERLLARVAPQVRLEVRGLGVRLAAALPRAAVQQYAARPDRHRRRRCALAAATRCSGRRSRRLRAAATAIAIAAAAAAVVQVVAVIARLGPGLAGRVVQRDVVVVHGGGQGARCGRRCGNGGPRCKGRGRGRRVGHAHAAIVAVVQTTTATAAAATTTIIIIININVDIDIVLAVTCSGLCSQTGSLGVGARLAHHLLERRCRCSSNSSSSSSNNRSCCCSCSCC